MPDIIIPMLSSTSVVEEIIKICPEWEPVLRGMSGDTRVGGFDLLNRLGAQAIYRKLQNLKDDKTRFVSIVREYYLQPHLVKMLSSNQNLRRFWGQRRMEPSEQKDNAVSLSADLSQKMETMLTKQLVQHAEDGFKVLLPAYIQRSVHNAVVDYVRQEWSWEKNTLQDMSLDPEQDDPRSNVADDTKYLPENIVMSAERVTQLNQLRSNLKDMLADASLAKEPFLVIDCMFGLGLTEYSTVGQEMTMREACEKLNIPGETQARKIARCQVYLDKGLDLIRKRIRENLPGIAESWQSEVNVNTASRRELAQQLDLTESEVERLIKGRQYCGLEELLDSNVVKPARLQELKRKGAVAAFVPVDINVATARDMTDILGLTKELSQKLVAERPYPELSELVNKKLLDRAGLEQIMRRGAVARLSTNDGKRTDLNRAELPEMTAVGLAPDTAHLIVKGRPFATWCDLEDYLGCEPSLWSFLREKFCLGISG
jgi:DNA uptake protein ComE-like DNA-binding protein